MSTDQIAVAEKKEADDVKTKNPDGTDPREIESVMVPPKPGEEAVKKPVPVRPEFAGPDGGGGVDTVH
jgi:hypothetical protein